MIAPLALTVAVGASLFAAVCLLVLAAVRAAGIADQDRERQRERGEG